MKKRLASILSLFALLALTVLPAWAAPPRQEIPDLEITGIALDPPVPYPGQDDVTVTITYQTRETTLPAQTTVECAIEIETTGEDPEQVSKTEPPLVKTLEADLAAGTPDEVSATIAVPGSEGAYSLTALLTIKDPAGKLVAQKEMSSSLTVESALPPGLSRLFAALGMFIAMMAIMAAGTEAVIEALRLPFGIKRKSTAMEAFQKLRSELPGQLASVGVNRESIKLFTQTCTGLEKRIAQAASASTVLQHIKNLQLKAAFEALQEIDVLAPTMQAGNATVNAQLDRIKEKAISWVGDGFVALRKRIPLDELSNQAESALVASIQEVKAGDQALDLLDQAVQGIQNLIVNNRPEWTETWLREQAHIYLAEGEAGVNVHLDLVEETLEDMGLPPNFVTNTVEGLRTRLKAAKTAVERTSNDYFTALGNLLQGVQNLRADIPERIRQWGLWICIALVAIAILAAVLLGTFGGLAIMYCLGIGSLGVVVGLPFVYYWWMDHMRIDNAAQDLTATTTAEKLLFQEFKQQREESVRVGILKVISLFMGVFLAYTLRVDALRLLVGIIPEQIVGKMNGKIVPAQNGLPAFTVGIVLTGLAATAGSKFWHDQLDKLQGAKQQAEKAAKTVQSMRGMVGTSGEEE